MNETPSGSQTPSSGDAPKPLGSPLAYLGAHYTTPDDLTLHKQISADLARFATLPEESSDVEVRKERRAIWDRLASTYWMLAWNVVERRSREDGKTPEVLSFAPEERLLLDMAALDDRLAPFDGEDFLASSARPAPVDRYQYYHFSDLLGEAFALLFGKELPCPRGGMRPEEKVAFLERRLEGLSRRRAGMQKTLLRHVSFGGMEDAEKNLRELETHLLDHVEVDQRVQHFRFAEDAVQVRMRESKALYDRTRQHLTDLLEPLRDGLAAMNLSGEFAQFLALTPEIEETAHLLVHCREEVRRLRDKRERLAEKLKSKSDAERRMELQDNFKNKRMFVEMGARRSRLHTSALYAESVTPPLTFAEISRYLAEFSALDPGLFASRRFRVHGYPRICIMPGRGNGVYDWEDHALLFPLCPASTPERSVAQALGLLRWDADDDRDLKDTYGALKDNRGKSIVGLQEDFCKEYLVWLTKEAKGYRVLSKESYNWFHWKIAGGSELGADVGKK